MKKGDNMTGNFRFKFDCSDINWCDVYNLLKNAGMATHHQDILRKAFNNSFAVIFVLEGERLIGMGRAISDSVCQATLYDITVDPEYQGKGLGRMITNELCDKLPGCNIILYATPGTEVFYKKLHFRKILTGMARFVDAERSVSEGSIE